PSSEIQLFHSVILFSFSHTADCAAIQKCMTVSEDSHPEHAIYARQLLFHFCRHLCIHIHHCVSILFAALVCHKGNIDPLLSHQTRELPQHIGDIFVKNCNPRFLASGSHITVREINRMGDISVFKEILYLFCSHLCAV